MLKCANDSSRRRQQNTQHVQFATSVDRRSGPREVHQRLAYNCIKTSFGKRPSALQTFCATGKRKRFDIRNTGEVLKNESQGTTPHTLDLAGHFGELEPDDLVVDQRLAER